MFCPVKAIGKTVATERRMERDMKYITKNLDFQLDKRSVVTLGKFDGVHKGHRRFFLYGIEQLLCCLLPHSCLLCHNKKRHIKQAAQKLRRLDRAHLERGWQTMARLPRKEKTLLRPKGTEKSVTAGSRKEKVQGGVLSVQAGFCPPTVYCRLPLRVKQNPQGIYLCREA